MRKALEIFIYSMFGFSCSEKFGWTDILKEYLPSLNKNIVFAIALLVAVIALILRIMGHSNTIKMQSQIGGKGNTQNMN